MGLANGDDPDGGDEDLEVYQLGSDKPWFATVMRDFERLTQPNGPGPLVAQGASS